MLLEPGTENLDIVPGHTAYILTWRAHRRIAQLCSWNGLRDGTACRKLPAPGCETAMNRTFPLRSGSSVPSLIHAEW